MEGYYKVFNKLSRVYEKVARIALADRKYAIGIWNNEYILDIIVYNKQNCNFDYYGSKETYLVLMDLCPDVRINKAEFGEYVYLKNKELKAFIKNNLSRFAEGELDMYENLRKIGKGFLRITFEQEKSFVIKNKEVFLFVAKGDCQTYERRIKHDAKYHERMLMNDRLVSKGYDTTEALKNYYELKKLYESVFND